MVQRKRKQNRDSVSHFHRPRNLQHPSNKHIFGYPVCIISHARFLVSLRWYVLHYNHSVYTYTIFYILLYSISKPQKWSSFQIRISKITTNRIWILCDPSLLGCLWPLSSLLPLLWLSLPFARVGGSTSLIGRFGIQPMAWYRLMGCCPWWSVGGENNGVF